LVSCCFPEYLLKDECGVAMSEAVVARVLSAESTSIGFAKKPASVLAWANGPGPMKNCPTA
jgi:hypothetical protein